MNEQLPIALLESYFAGNCGLKEKALINDWYRSFEQIEDDVSPLPPEEHQIIKSIMWENIIGNINADSARLPGSRI